MLLKRNKDIGSCNRTLVSSTKEFGGTEATTFLLRLEGSRFFLRAAAVALAGVRASDFKGTGGALDAFLRPVWRGKGRLVHHVTGFGSHFMCGNGGRLAGGLGCWVRAEGLGRRSIGRQVCRGRVASIGHYGFVVSRQRFSPRTALVGFSPLWNLRRATL